MWQVADGFDGAFLTAGIGLFLLVGIAILLTRLPRELDRLAHFDDPDQVAAEVVGTPAAAQRAGAVSSDGALSARQRGNVLLLALFSPGVQVVLVTGILGGFFVAFGLRARQSVG